MRNTRYKTGSALILAVVLVSLLAVVGVMFAMVARIDKMSTSAIAENKTLNLAVDTVIAKISQELASDTPVLGEEYYDYPDVNNTWLASLEPYESGGNYYWRQISDVTGFLNDRGFSTQNVNVRPVGLSTTVYVREYPVIKVDSDGNFLKPNNNPATDGVSADADGDGIADSKWIELNDITSSKGKPIYAAIRIIDNGGMLNVNTGYKFDPADPNLADGSSQMQIDLLTLAKRGSTPNPESRLNNARYGSESQVLSNYIKDVIWQYNVPDGNYTPFDISDELEVRNRFFINHPDIDTRIEEMWDNAFQVGRRTPFDSNFPDWCEQAIYIDTNEYDYRHIATTYNMDRIINPVGGKMVNINDKLISAEDLYIALLASIDPNINPDMYIDDANRVRIKNQFAQLAANIVDFADDNIEVTVFKPGDPDIRPAYYGFDAQPFITEIGFIIDAVPQSGRNYYAVELYNPFDSNIPLEDFELVLIDSDDPLSRITVDFNSSDAIPADGHFVIANDLSRFNIDLNNTNTKEGPILAFFGGWQPPLSVAPPPPPGPPVGIAPPSPPEGAWKYNYILYLTRKVGGPADPNIYVDRQWIDPPVVPGVAGYFGRDVRDWRIVYQNLVEDPVGTLGSINTIESSELFLFSFFLPNPLVTAQKFITVGDIPRVLTIGHGDGLNSTIGEQLFWRTKDEEHLVRLDLQNPYYSNIFQYLTVFDPSSDNIDNDGDNGPDENDRSEWKIPGRININTAPWYVIAQLPWVSYELAKAIADYRDLRRGFGSIGDLMQVGEMSYYVDDSDLTVFPDLTAGDDIIDDFEERDVIFSRISNLVTVRSDVFTAYILVRIGNDGPQKRTVAILDRSDVYPGGVGRVKARALHPVPDPR